MRHAALFLDRDGVINIDYHYVYLPKDFVFVDGIFDLVAAANRLGYKVIVVTNQAGIGRGLYTECDFENLTDWMKEQFKIRSAYLDDVYYCPFHPEFGIGKYLVDSDMRKPAPGMLIKAAEDHQIDFSRSIMVGDKETDMIAGKLAGVGTLLLFDSINHQQTSNWKIVNSLKNIIDLLERVH